MTEPVGPQARRLLRLFGIGLACLLAALFLWAGPRQHLWFVLVVLTAFLASVAFTLWIVGRKK